MVLFPPGVGGGEFVSRGYKGKGVTIHLITEGSGHPISIKNTSATGDERKQVLPLLRKLPFKFYKKDPMPILEADKGYDCYWLREKLLAIGVFPLISRRRFKGKKTNQPQTQEVRDYLKIKKKRWQVERAFSWMKRKYRRLLVRWERKQTTWVAFTHLALIIYWINILLR